MRTCLKEGRRINGKQPGGIHTLTLLVGGYDMHGVLGWFKRHEAVKLFQ